jgi:hypothetical protein
MRGSADHLGQKGTHALVVGGGREAAGQRTSQGLQIDDGQAIPSHRPHAFAELRFQSFHEGQESLFHEVEGLDTSDQHGARQPFGQHHVADLADDPVPVAWDDGRVRKGQSEGMDEQGSDGEPVRQSADQGGLSESQQETSQERRLLVVAQHKAQQGQGEGQQQR